MTWIERLAEQTKLSQQVAVTLSLKGVHDLLRGYVQDATQIDTPGQGYLFEGEEFAELQRLRSLQNPDFESLVRIRELFLRLFEVISDNLKDDASDFDPDDMGEDYMEEQLSEYASMYAQEYQFGSDEEYEFFQHLDDPEARIQNLWMGSSSKGEYIGEKYTTIHTPAMDIPEIITPANFRKIYDEAVKLENQLERSGYSLESNSKNILAAYQKYRPSWSIIKNDYQELQKTLTSFVNNAVDIIFNTSVSPSTRRYQVLESLASDLMSENVLREKERIDVDRATDQQKQTAWLSLIWEINQTDDSEAFKQILTNKLTELVDRNHYEDFVAVQSITQQLESVLPGRTSLILPVSAEDIKSACEEYQKSITNYNDSEQVKEVIAAFTDEVVDIILEDYNQNSFHRDKNLSDVWLPEWVNEKAFKDLLGSEFESEFEEWYMDNNKHWLMESLLESESENHYENFRETKRELEHAHGFDVLKLLSSDWGYLGGEQDLNEFEEILNETGEEDFEDKRFTLVLDSLTDIASDLNTASNIAGAAPTSSYINMYAHSIKQEVDSSQILSPLFQTDLSRVTIEPDKVVDGMALAVEEHEYVPENIRDAEINQLIEMREKAEAEKAKLHEMLSSRTYTLLPEELAKMKELGLARKPFGHTYSLQRGRYPGAGFSRMPSSVEPFVIQIQPVDVGSKVPFDLITDTELHSTEGTLKYPLGWVGGYADYANLIMYINEAQSDLMQRTVHMRDPKKVKVQREQEVEKLQQEISRLQQASQTLTSPKQQLMQKLDRIRQENETIDPSTPQYTNNLAVIDRLLEQLPNVPETVDTSRNDTKIQQLQGQLQQAESRLNEPINEAAGVESSFRKKYVKWHDYKSKVENLFKDWIPIFFNVAIREARSRGFQKVRIISSQSLMKSWQRFAKSPTKELFERVYDATAQKYNATEKHAWGQDWFEVFVQAEDLRFAQTENIMKYNWLQQIIKKAETDWLMEVPGTEKQVWQIHLDTFFSQLQQGGFGWDAGDNEQIYMFSEWLKYVPPELKSGDDLEENFQRKVREYLRLEYDFDPYEHDTPVRGKEDWQRHIDVFFDTMKQREPGLSEPEFGAEGWQANEGNREIFNQWLEEVPRHLKEGSDLEPTFKQKVREYLIKQRNFDPYEFDEPDEDQESDIGAPSPDELERWWGG